jgi:hypothetical protein
MYLFFFSFITYYTYFSLMCLIKDIFLGEHNIIKYELQNTVDLYRNSLNKNIESIINLIPFFVILEIMYSYSDEYNYLKSSLQLIFQIYFSYFISILISTYKTRESSKNDNKKLICVFNMIQHDACDLYMYYLLPLSFLPFTIGLNKLTIDIIFNLTILFFSAKNSNMAVFVNLSEKIESNLKIIEFEHEVKRIFSIVGKKYANFSNREGNKVQIKEE